MAPAYRSRQRAGAESDVWPAPVLARQEAMATIPSTYGSLRASPDPGAVVGITLGAAGGFIALLFLLYTCINMAGGGVGDGATSVGTASMVTRKTRRARATTASHGRHASRSRSRSRSHHRRRETVEVRRTTARGQSVVVEERAPGGVERVVVEERRRSVSRPAPPPPAPPPAPHPDVSESEDEIVVIEETAPRRHRSRRRSSAERRIEYREVRRTSGTR